MLKSRPDRYGAIAVSIHWLSAVLMLALLGSGFRAADAMDAATKAGLLRFHIPVAIVVLLLMALRIVWWWRFDRKPAPVQASPRWQERLAVFVHVAFYIFILGMVASGIGIMILSGAAPPSSGQPAPRCLISPPIRRVARMGSAPSCSSPCWFSMPALRSITSSSAAITCCGGCGMAAEIQPRRPASRQRSWLLPIPIR